MVDLERRRAALECDTEHELQARLWLPVVASLRALRGVDRLTAVTLMAELGDLRRFPTARQFMAYLGLTPSEHSSGGKRQTGAITKTGNGVIRRLLTESAWTYRHPARETYHLQRKAADSSDYAKARAWAAQKRLCRRYRTMLEQSKQVKTVVTAIALELAGYIWDIACHEMPEAVTHD
ncbi:MAG: transposase [Gammaproteobacteria bacterium]|nr:transposase [Gammaproteobacteria bacterium]